ncbi:MAG: hypothetical protein KAU17_09400 [Spirochaetales bacterium]|jgi:hypothetical protein|nr:hypothetical protein [Spirochaetales bacterium]
MKKIHLLIALLVALSFTGCLEFGENEETITPTKTQVDRCRSEMYLNPSAKITPLGFKLEGSGIDDAIWFKFKTKSANLAEIFDSKVVDTSKFTNDFSSFHEMKKLKWWDVKDKNLFGGQVSLPYARFMNIGAEKTEEGYMIYIIWHET